MTPKWLSAMRAITGTDEEPGSDDNPKILAMRDEIAQRFPDMKWYCDLYHHDETPWCGLAVAYCMAMADIRPVFKPMPAPDTDRFLWAEAWASDPTWGVIIDEPRLGCVVVTKTSAGHHVTLYEHTSGDYYYCRGGNQSDSVNVSGFKIANTVALVWPRDGGPMPPPERPELEYGDRGEHVAEVQRILAIPVDGDFGKVTEGAVKGFQAGWGLGADGIVGDKTWERLDVLSERVRIDRTGLTEDEQIAIVALAEHSALASYSWQDRGSAPPGYVAGMALSFAVALTLEGSPIFHAMAKANSGKTDTDVLAWYAPEFKAQGWSNQTSGIDTLRHLWCLLIGLGMRESSGRYCEGRDQSASNTSSDTAEAGLFQTSWNINTASPEIGRAFDNYWANTQGFVDDFAEGVEPGGTELQNYGSDRGTSYQWLAKYAPAFACVSTAIGLRERRQHWGPINRREVELIEEANELLRGVQRVIEQQGGDA